MVGAAAGERHGHRHGEGDVAARADGQRIRRMVEIP